MKQRKGIHQRILSIVISLIISSGIVFTVMPMSTWAEDDVHTDEAGESGEAPGVEQVFRYPIITYVKEVIEDDIYMIAEIWDEQVISASAQNTDADVLTAAEANSSNGLDTNNTEIIGTGISEYAAQNNGQGNINVPAGQEPETGIADYPQFYATIVVIAGLSYIIVLFLERHGMTEARKDTIIARLVRWAKRGRGLRRLFAKMLILLVLAYYHGIGRLDMIESE